MNAMRKNITCCQERLEVKIEAEIRTTQDKIIKKIKTNPKILIERLDAKTDTRN
jgi:hypothetical protein